MPHRVVPRSCLAGDLPITAREARLASPEGKVRERVLRISFDDPEAFQAEYASNLASGGVFVETEEAFDLRERVTVAVELSFCDQRAELTGEVVHQITLDMARLGGAAAGVAVQFEGSASAVRARLEPLRTAAGAPVHEPVDSGRRRAPRSDARVAARIEASTGSVSGQTRNLSQTGVLIAVRGSGVPVGERVDVSLSDPETGESMSVGGVVVREVETDGGVSALAIDFAPSDAQRDEVQNFVEQLQSSEHTRRLGGIAGDIAELGTANLLQMLSATGNPGTLTLCAGEREAVIGCEGGLLRYVRVGPVSGMKALVRLLAWHEGSFEFHARLDPVDSTEPPMPLEAALIEGLRLLDEERANGDAMLPAEARPRLVDAAAADAEELSKTEAAVLDLVRAGFDVGRMVAVIPEPDLEVHRAITALCERGVLAA